MTDKAENIITTELVKSNVTEVVLADLKKQYLPLKINGIDDKEGYTKVHDARIKCRDLRVLTVKICKKGREDAVKIQKDWISKEKEVVEQITVVEAHLQKEESAIDDAKEAIKIRAERLLKLPGRKEQTKDIVEYVGFEDSNKKITPLTDEMILSFNDTEWQQIILLAKEKKLAEAEIKLAVQQKVIDDAKALEIEKRTVIRVNELIATGATLHLNGTYRVYRKGTASVNEQTIKECIDEGWPKVLEVFKNVPEPTPPIQTKGWGRADEPTVSQPKITEISDEEKLFNFASSIEKLPRPALTTTSGKATLIRAELLLTQTINLLRQ